MSDTPKTEQPATTALSLLIPVAVDRQVMTREDAEKAVTVLQKGYELSLKNLDGITEVNRENRDAVVEQLTTVKRFYDKIKATRVPFTKLLDDLKEHLMSFERPSDYNDRKSLYSQKRALVETYDQQQLIEARRLQARAERTKKIAVYKADLKAAVQRGLVDMIADKKKGVITAMGAWEAKLTLETIDEQEKKLLSQSPVLRREDYEKLFVINNATVNILSNEELDETPEDRQKDLNIQRYNELFAEFKTEFPYDKFNAEYIEAVAPIINSLRARIPEIKKSLKENDEKRLEEIKKRTEEQTQQVAVEHEARLDEVTHQKDMNTLEAEFVQQGTTQDIDTPNAEKKAVFENEKNWLKPFLEMVAHVAALPEFPEITKKGEYIPAIKFFVTLYERKCQDKPVKGVKWVEKAKTTIRSTE